MKALIEAGCSVNKLNRAEMTPLLNALAGTGIAGRNDAIVKLLISENCDVNKPGTNYFIV